MANVFTWFEKFGEAIAKMPRDKGDELIAALVRYGAYGELPEFDDWALEGMFVTMRDDIDCSVKSRNDNKGGRGRKEPQAQEKPQAGKNEKPQVSKIENPHSGKTENPLCEKVENPPAEESENPPAEESENPPAEESENPHSGKTENPFAPESGNPIQDNTRQDNTRQKVKTILSGGAPDDPVPYAEIVGYLNSKAGTGYKPSSEKTKACIRARWRDGFRLDDFRRVIDSKAAEWKGDERMSRYLRPETLFGAKFEGYLQTAPLATAAKAIGAAGSAHAPDYSREGW